MSNKQEKKEQRVKERKEFLNERRKIQLAVFQLNFDKGLAFYENVKEKLSAEEVAVIEAQIEENKALIEKLKSEIDN